MKKLLVFKMIHEPFMTPWLRLIWEAPFKSESELLKNIIDFSGRGFYCSVIVQ